MLYIEGGHRPRPANAEETDLDQDQISRDDEKDEKGGEVREPEREQTTPLNW